MWLTPATAEFPLKVTDAHILWLRSTRVCELESPRHPGAACAAVSFEAHAHTKA